MDGIEHGIALSFHFSMFNSLCYVNICIMFSKSSLLEPQIPLFLTSRNLHQCLLKLILGRLFFRNFTLGESHHHIKVRFMPRIYEYPLKYVEESFIQLLII